MIPSSEEAVAGLEDPGVLGRMLLLLDLGGVRAPLLLREEELVLDGIELETCRAGCCRG